MSPRVKSISAVLIGFVVIGVLAFGAGALFASLRPGDVDANGVPTTTAAMLIQLLYVGVFATFGCWLAGRLAPNRPMFHALVLGVLGLVFNVVSAIPIWGAVPTWYLAVGFLTTMLWAWIGGAIAESQAGPTQGAAVAA